VNTVSQCNKFQKQVNDNALCSRKSFGLRLNERKSVTHSRIFRDLDDNHDIPDAGNARFSTDIKRLVALRPPSIDWRNLNWLRSGRGYNQSNAVP
jgi:hypothetical protein